MNASYDFLPLLILAPPPRKCFQLDRSAEWRACDSM
jgi:hypothetical protein